MAEVVRLVLEKYDGSLKAEHGTGRNMAPFVEKEWGKTAFGLMRTIKDLFDPRGLLNPGVILNSDLEPILKISNPCRRPMNWSTNVLNAASASRSARLKT
jgi:D-lactate dehydrogenase